MSKAKFGGLGCLGIGLVGVLALAAIVVMYGIPWNNTAVTLKEGVESQWANVESSYQLRNDLIPNIVATAQEYAEFEKETLEGVMKARAQATSINVDASNLTTEQIEQFSKAQGAVRSGLGRLLATYENYPDLKANENFKELINELTRVEKRINVERNRYNEKVKAYNLHIKKFPGMLLADFLGFGESPYFQADAGSENAPDVKDLFNN